MHDQQPNVVEHRVVAASPLRTAVPEGNRKRPRPAILRSGRRADPGRIPAPAPVSGSETDPGPPASTALDDDHFKAELIALIPNLRAFAISLAGRATGDDFAQDALAKAWKSRASFEPGTSMKAWTFTILRNQFLSEKRRSWRSQPLEPGVAENTLVSTDDPTSREELVDVRNAMQLLPDEQREALILAGPAGLSYEETAKICGCAVGTVKSRVSRARTSLAALLEEARIGKRARSKVSSINVIEEIMQGATNLKRRMEQGAAG